MKKVIKKAVAKAPVKKTVAKKPMMKIGGSKKPLRKAQPGTSGGSDSTRMNAMNPNFSYDVSRPQVFEKPNPLPPVVSKKPQTGRGSGMGKMYMDDMSNPLPENKKGGAIKATAKKIMLKSKKK